jgi:lipopolysaccharide export system protein LptA
LVLSTDSTQAAAPQVADGRLTIGAREIELQLAEKALKATGSVQSTMNPRRRGTRSGETLPALLSDDEAAYVAASTLSYDGDALVAAYGGGARLWQGDTLVQGDRLTLDGVAGDLAASGDVRTVLALVDPDNAELSSRTTAESAELEYDEDGRQITCIGSARLRGPEGDVQAERIVLELTESGRELARADAMESVQALLEGKYFITGSHLIYEAPDGRYVVEGAPVRIVEEGPSGCFETTGAVLTLLRSTATIDVDGTDASRSRTRQVPCPERRR